MSPRRLRLDAPSLVELTARIEREHGPRARILSAERVTVGGLRGLFAKSYFEAEVEIADEPGGPLAAMPVDGAAAAGASAAGPSSARGGPASAAAPGLPPAAGLDALLDEAERAEERMHAGLREDVLREPEPRRAHVSTERPDFARLLDEIVAVTAPEPPQAPVPAVRSAAGDLVLVVGLGAVALAVARTMAVATGARLAVSGAIEEPGLPRVDDRRSGAAFRADGVQHARGGIVAAGLPAALPVDPARLEGLRGVPADQVWIVVDAGRKHEDTARWVGAVGAVVPVDALAVVGVAGTASPASVNELRIPIGWIDAVPAHAPVL